MKKLTRRQQEFLSRFVKLSSDEEGVHYSDVARHLDVGKVTAYEMLSLLEERGLVRRAYRLKEKNRGPGRSTVIFLPTEQARQLMQDRAEDTGAEKDWESRKDRILQQLRERKAETYDDLLNDLLHRIPEQHSPLIYTTEMITTIVLLMTSLKDAPEMQRLFERLKRIGQPGEIRLSAMTGIGLAFSVLENINSQMAGFLLNQSGKFQSMLSEIGEEGRALLNEYTSEIVDIVYP